MARPNRRTVLMWALYALFFLIVLLVQDAVLSKYTVHGARVVLVPVAAACVAVHTDAERGGLFCLLAGLFWTLTGASDGGLMLLCMTFSGAVCGYLCSSFFHPRVLPAVVLSMLGLALCLCVGGLIRMYLEGLSFRSMIPIGTQLLLALPASPVLHWCCKAIRKAGP